VLICFIYKTNFDNGLTEHEFDHVFFGTTNTNPVINKEEVESFVWVDVNNLISDIKTDPNKYTSWFKIAME
jgi:isopentenyl-diphosphate delta-isomerase